MNKTDQIKIKPRQERFEGAIQPEEMDQRPSIYGLTYEALDQWVRQEGGRVPDIRRIWDYLYRDRVDTFDQMEEVQEDLRQKLIERFRFDTLEVVIQQAAQDGTTKYLFRMNDHLLIETVLMNHGYGLSVCVTTQVGCNIGCTFCASGLIAKQRDLTTGEIVSQIMRVQRILDEAGEGAVITHMVAMGIGEPFDNYDQVMDFLRIMTDDRGLAIRPRSITVSTSGLAPQIRRFADEDLRVNLAISLHASNNEVRSRIMRINRKYSLEELFDAIAYYIEQTNRRVTFEYIMLSEVNDQPQHARELVDWMTPIADHAYVNLIPYNPVAGAPYERSPRPVVQAFSDQLQAHGINCFIRREHGTEIDAACGQLRSNHLKRQRRRASR